MLRGYLLSLIFHIIIILLIIYVIPEFFSKNKRNIEIAVDIITTRELEDKPYFSKKNIIKSAEKPKKVESKKEDNKIIEVKKTKAKKTTKVKPVKKTQKSKKLPPISLKKKTIIDKSADSDESDGQKEDQELEGLLDEIKRVQQEETEKLYREQYIYGKGLNPHEKKNIRKQINSCWNNIVKKLFSKEEIMDIKVKVVVSLDQEGNVLEARLANAVERYMELDNSLYRQVADSALSTFYRCNKILNLPKHKYEYWKEFEFIFDPNDI